MLALGGPGRAPCAEVHRIASTHWRTSVRNSPTSSSLNPSWQKRSRYAPTVQLLTARCAAACSGPALGKTRPAKKAVQPQGLDRMTWTL